MRSLQVKLRVWYSDSQNGLTRRNWRSEVPLTVKFVIGTQQKYFVKFTADKSQINLDRLQISKLCFYKKTLSWVSVINGP